jgi:hypothetical protein
MKTVRCLDKNLAGPWDRKGAAMSVGGLVLNSARRAIQLASFTAVTALILVIPVSESATLGSLPLMEASRQASSMQPDAELLQLAQQAIRRPTAAPADAGTEVNPVAATAGPIRCFGRNRGSGERRVYLWQVS